MTRLQGAFLALIVAQAAHSTEEYLGRLYEVFAPARFVSGLLSRNLELGFLIFNAALVGFGLWAFFWPVRQRWPSAVPLAWFWAMLELLNGIGHLARSLTQLRYTPGAATALPLLLLSLYLVRSLRGKERSSGDPGPGRRSATSGPPA